MLATLALLLAHTSHATAQTSAETTSGPNDSGTTLRGDSPDAIAGSIENTAPVPALAFELPIASGGTIQLAPTDDTTLTVVCFLGTECPLARLYAPRLNQLAERFDGRVRFIGIDSNRQDSVEEIVTYAAKYGITFPIARDHGNALADQYGATRTPEVFVLDHRLEIRYRGRIDDQYQPGNSRSTPDRHDLQVALDELLAGQAVSIPQTEVAGCFIGKLRKPQASRAGEDRVTWCREIVRVMQTHCIECHRQGEIGPFSLTNYDDAVSWSDTILETLNDGRMPPWHANPHYGQFSNTRYMPDADKQLVRDWVSSGMPYGQVTDLPEPPTFTDGWQLESTPELVLTMRDRPFPVPAEGTVEYQYFVVDPGFTEDKWITAAQVIPGNRSVVHHAVIFVRPPDGSTFRGIGWLTAYVPGQRARPLPPGRAKKVAAGSKLVFQMHYTPTGTATEDITRVGLQFANKEEVTHEVYTVIGIDQQFEIPPETADFPVDVNVPRLPQRGELLAVAPHMHLRGRSFRLFAAENGHEQILLDVPRYDFNWQHVYFLQKPFPLSDSLSMRFTVHFDNSTANPFNPDPGQYVTWGDQTWEEMAVAFFEVAEPLDDADIATDASMPESRSSGSPAVKAGVQAAAPNDSAAEDFVKRYLEKFDRDGNGTVEQREVPRVVRAYGFEQLDLNSDGVLTREELLQSARYRAAE